MTVMILSCLFPQTSNWRHTKNRYFDILKSSSSSFLSDVLSKLLFNNVAQISSQSWIKCFTVVKTGEFDFRFLTV